MHTVATTRFTIESVSRTKSLAEVYHSKCQQQLPDEDPGKQAAKMELDKACLVMRQSLANCREVLSGWVDSTAALTAASGSSMCPFT